MGEQRNEGPEKFRACVQTDGIRYAIRQDPSADVDDLPKFGHGRCWMKIMTSSRRQVI